MLGRDSQPLFLFLLFSSSITYLGTYLGTCAICTICMYVVCMLYVYCIILYVPSTHPSHVAHPSDRQTDTSAIRPPSPSLPPSPSPSPLPHLTLPHLTSPHLISPITVATSLSLSFF